MENKLLSRPTLLFTSMLMAGFVALTFIPFDLLVSRDELGRHMQKVIVFLLVIAICLWLARKMDVWGEGGFSLSRVSNPWMLGMPLLFPGMLYLENISNGCYFRNEYWWAMMVFLILRGMMEEVMFRGLLQGYLVRKFPLHSRFRIILFTTIAFALLHFVAIRVTHVLAVVPQVIYAFFVGLLFGAVQLRVRNVWLLGVVHGLLNLMSKSCSEPTGGPGSWGEYFGSLLVITLAFSPALLISWLIIKASPEQKKIKSGSAG